MPEAVSTVGLLVGYALLNTAARAGSAVSPEARAVQRSAFSVVQTTEDSVALFGEKRMAISKIWSLAAECGASDWDGYQANPIQPSATSLAIDFIRALPGGFPLPESSPEPDGEIALDWIESRYRVFSLSCGRTSRLAYAWIDGSDRGHGVARFDGENVPLRILQGIINIVRKENASVRVA